ncbi:MAG: DUF4177 domain-containing protein [Proteobacteria bacterium]|nr:DUF4177 domain-containing protein [Pseudomonadota bacterium]
MHEYKVVPAPQRAAKTKGLKTTADRFAHTLAERINAEAAGGWHFVRTETLPCEERSRLGSVRVSQQVVMIFARELGATRPDAGAALAAAQGVAAPAAEAPAPAVSAAPTATPLATPLAAPLATPVRRQEPLFRSGAMLRAEGAARSEPVLRPRGTGAEDDAQG